MKKIYLYTITALLLCSGATQAQNPWGFPYEREWATYLPIANSYTWSLYTKNDGSVLLTTSFNDVSPGNDNLDNLITPDAYQPLKTDDFSMFLGVTDSKGKGEFKYATYVNYGTIAIDKRDNFYLSGATLAQTNIATPGAYQQHLKGNEKISDGAITLPDGSTVPPPIPLRDGFIIKFNAQTKQPEWGTYFNGDDGETTIEIFGFDEKSLYFTGTTTSTSGIATPGAAFPNPITSSKKGQGSPRLMGRMTTDGKLLWCTYIHPLITETRYNSIAYGSYGVGLDSQSNIYYTSDNAVYKLDKDGNFIKKYSDVFEEGGRIYISPNDKMYILGLALKDSPVLSTSGTYKVTKKAEYECYLSCYNLDMQKQWGTYIVEGNYSRVFFSLSFDRWGNPILMTATNKNGLASADAHQTAVQGKNDHFILSLNQDGQFNWATYYGGKKNEYDNTLMLSYHVSTESTQDALYFGGITESSTMIATEDSAYPKMTDSAANYLAKFVPLVTASVDKAEESDFVLWPNPANELLHLRSNTVLTEQSMLTIYDLKGKKVLAVKADPANVQVINVSSLAKGSYILRVEDANNGINHSVKFVKK